MKTQITLSQAFDGYLLDARARRLSPHTIEDYTRTFRRFIAYTGDLPLATITAGHIRIFLAHLADTTVTLPGIAPRAPRVLSKKTILNIHTGLAAVWTWAIAEDLVATHVVRAVSRPVPGKTAIVPFSRDDVAAMLTACKRSAPYTRPGKRESTHARPTAVRDRAIILTFLDTGARVSELTGDRHDLPGLRLRQVDLNNHRLTVTGKGIKQRLLPISSITAKAIWRYTTTRPDADPDEHLLLSHRAQTPLTRSGVLALINRLGQRAGVPDAYPHRFRHTFAINFLRNGGNVLELKHLLGHTTLEMVQRYVAIAQVDVENAHKRASPVSNWRL